jgi:hypothetical protein
MTRNNNFSVNGSPLCSSYLDFPEDGQSGKPGDSEYLNTAYDESHDVSSRREKFKWFEELRLLGCYAVWLL